MKKIKTFLSNELGETKALLRSVPAVPFTILVLSIVLMNLLASKLIVDIPWLALDGGYLLSWVAFLGMDMIVRLYGPKASIKLIMFALLFNIGAIIFFTLVDLFPGEWPLQGYASTFSWWIVGASTTAFIISGIVASLLHWSIRGLYKEGDRNKFSAFCICSWISTIVGQFVDNFVFGLIFTYFAFGLTMTQLLMFAVAGAIGELIYQILFTRFGYRISEKWRNEGRADEYNTLLATHKDLP